MPSPAPSRFSPLSFCLSLGALALLALVPEFIVFAHDHEDAKKALPIIYYALLFSFLLFTPAWWLPARGARAWMLLVGLATAVTTLVTGFQAVSIGARWDQTAHAALMQTYGRQIWDFTRFFGSSATIGWLLLLAAAFAGCLYWHLRAPRPSRRAAFIWTLAGLLLGAYGIHNCVRYGRRLTRPIVTNDGTTLAVAGTGVNNHHPLLRFALNHYNYRVTHDYYLAAYRAAALQRDALAGAQPVADALPPRIVLVVIGESAGRRHWSLYGYGRATTPQLAVIQDELVIYSDVVSTCVGTQASLRQMFDTTLSSQPVFPLFSQAGYKTHWISSKPDQGVFDTEIAALVQSCDERIFLHGAYDEAVLPHVQRAIATSGRHIIFVNLFGSHIRYKDRYPAKRAVFHGKGAKADTIAAYDNTIHYTDLILSRLIDLLRAEREPSCFLYVSDHAEDIYDSTPDRYLFRSDDLATDPMYEVPFVLWFSPAYRAGNAAFIASAIAARDRPCQTPELYHSLIDLARLRHPVYDDSRSVFSPRYLARDRHVGGGRRLYIKPAH